MIEYILTSLIILPHGITDLSQIPLTQLPKLCLFYLMNLMTCGFLHEYYPYGHVFFFLFSSWIHFSQDFYSMKFPLHLSSIGGLSVVSIPSILLYYNYLLYAKYFMLSYMIFFHVPLHYYRIRIRRKDISAILLFTFLFGMIGPSTLALIEQQSVQGPYSVIGCGIVTGHVFWNFKM